METILQDIRFGFRNLRKTRGLTLVAVLTLALGIGANTAIFSVVDAVLLRPLPFQQPKQLVRLYETEAAPGNFPFNGQDFMDWRAQNKTFTDMALYGWSNDMNLSGEGQPAHVSAVSTEANFFSVIGAQPLMGRTFAAGEDQPGNDRYAILSFGLWHSQFGGDAHILNQQIELNSRAYTVIGVMPPTFHYPSSAQLWVPQDVDIKHLAPRGSHWANAIGRMKPDVTVAEAQADLKVVAARLAAQFPNSNDKTTAVVVPLQEDTIGDSRNSLVMMLAAVALVLLIACVNVANLLLSRAVARQKEMAVRVALGAARGRLVRQLLTESVLLALSGGVLGLALAAEGVHIIAGLKHLGLPQANAIQLNLPVLGFTLGVALLAGILFGIVPALQISRPGLHDELRGGAGSSTSPTRNRRLASNVLVVAEVAFSVLLLISAGLLLKDFLRLRGADIGVRIGNVWTASMRLPAAKYQEPQQQLSLAQQFLARIQSIPGVESAALTSHLPLEGGSNFGAKPRGRPSQPGWDGILVENHTVGAGYFRTMGIPLMAGRDVNEHDVQMAQDADRRIEDAFKQDHPPAELINGIVQPVVINQRFADTYWRGQNPLGQMFSHGGDTGPWSEVVGVVGDVKEWSLSQKAVPEAYYAYSGDNRLTIVAHTTVPPDNITAPARRALAELDSSLPLFSVRSMQEVVDEHAAGQQFVAGLTGLFAGLALLLAAIGIYGVLSYGVTQRTREIGIRMSLGANRGHVLRLVLGQGSRLIAAGFALGIGGAIAAQRLLSSSLHVIKPGDPEAFVAAPLLLAAIALLACYVPARRASRIHPVQALRQE